MNDRQTSPYHAEAPSSSFLAIVIAGVTLGFVFIALTPVHAGDRPKPERVALTNYKNLATSVNIYVADWDERLPLAANWSDGVYTYTKNKHLRLSPEDPKGGPATAYMRRLSGQLVSSISHQSKQAMLFETTDRSDNAAYNFVNVWWRKERPTAVAFVDGSAKLYRQTDPAKPKAGTGRAP